MVILYFFNRDKEVYVLMVVIGRFHHKELPSRCLAVRIADPSFKAATSDGSCHL